MSQENVEVAMEAFRRFPDRGTWDEWAMLLHPECHTTVAPGWPEPGPFVGREAVVREWQRLFEDWSEHRFENIEVAAESEDWVVVTWRWMMRGAASGIEAEVDLATAFRIEDGQIIEGHFRWSLDEALNAAGLSE